ncbi:MAG TPA: Xaa-Pro peptidase family protein [Terriglobales bacterium]|nr:Xaa-Pro peptidase family protein [Terriglobales bacterium]
MISRRRLLQFTAAAAGAGAALRWTPASVLAKEGPLPPSLAVLKSMKSLAKPITREERAARLEKARRLMAENRLDAILLIGGTSLVYFTGIRWWLSERLFALVVPARGQAFFVCPAFEADRAHEQIALGPLDKDTPVLLWEEDESPHRLVAQGLKERGIASGRLGIEETVRFVYADGVAKAAPALELVSATPVTAGCRQVKSAHEIELMRLASKVTITAYEAAWRALKPGMTESDFETLVSTAHERLGFEGGAGVQTGIYSALPHGSLTPQVIRENTILLMDGGCRVEGYESDISRTFVLGKPSDKMKKVFEIVHKAQSAALGAARPEVEAQAVDAAARKVIEEAGYGPGYKYFSHRVGHGIGMDGHEWPYLVRGDAVALQPDMVFSDEPGIYIRGEFGVRLEDDLHITENGAELFTSQSPSLEHPFG